MPETTPPILFLPGAAGDGNFWRPVASRLPATRRTVLLDWPGLGDVPPAPTIVGFDDLVRLTLAHLDGPTDVVAQSMGGVVAIQAALARPAAIRRLVLVATSGGMDLAAFGAEDWRPDYRQAYPRAASWIVTAHHDLSDALLRIRVPALLIWGDADPVSPVAVGQALARRLPDARLVVIPGGTHALARECPDIVAQHVTTHLYATMGS